MYVLRHSLDLHLRDRLFAYYHLNQSLQENSLSIVNAVNELMKSESDNPTIALLICKDKNQTEVQWAFQGIETPRGVATYDNIRLQEIKSQLPSEEAIQKRL